MQNITVTQQTYFTVSIASFSVAGSTVSMANTQSLSYSILDTGTTEIIIADYQNCNSLINAIRSSNMYSDPNHHLTNSFWYGGGPANPAGVILNDDSPLTVRFSDGAAVDILPSAIFFETSLGVSNTPCQFIGGCMYLGIQVCTQSSSGPNIMGAPFFFNHVVFFDRGVPENGQPLQVRVGKSALNCCKSFDRSLCEFHSLLTIVASARTDHRRHNGLRLTRSRRFNLPNAATSVSLSFDACSLFTIAPLISLINAPTCSTSSYPLALRLQGYRRNVGTEVQDLWAHWLIVFISPYRENTTCRSQRGA